MWVVLLWVFIIASVTVLSLIAICSTKLVENIKADVEENDTRSRAKIAYNRCKQELEDLKVFLDKSVSLQSMPETVDSYKEILSIYNSCWNRFYSVCRLALPIDTAPMGILTYAIEEFNDMKQIIENKPPVGWKE